MVARIRLTNDDLAPLELDEGLVEVIEQFKHLRSLVEVSNGVFGAAGLLKHLGLLGVYVMLYFLPYSGKGECSANQASGRKKFGE